MLPYRLLNVFVAEDGSYGNPLGVFLDVASGRMRIFTPASELPLAGRPGADGTVEVGGRVADRGDQAYGN